MLCNLRKLRPVFLAFLWLACVGHVECLGKNKFINDVTLEPENVEVVFQPETCGDSAFVTWNPPSKDILVESYRVTCEAVDFTDRVVEVVDGQTTQVVIGPLKSDTTFICSVASWTKFHGASGVVYSKAFLTEK